MPQACFARFRVFCTGVLALIAVDASAVQSVTLPTWVCAHPDAIFVNSFESGQIAVPHEPSNGSGGAYPGNVTRTLYVAGLGLQTYYLHLPNGYTPRHSWPLMLALHGAGGPGTSDYYARLVRADWSALANAQGFIVAAPVGSDSQGGWIAPASATDHPSDYDLFAAIRADLEGAYNIERSRIYGWGFSAGGHVMHDLGVNTYSSAFNASTMAAYGVSAGDLAGLACEGLSDAQCSGLLAALPRKIPVDIHLGNSDPLYTMYGAGNDPTRFENNGWVLNQTLFYTLFNGGHEYFPSQLGDIWHNLCPNAVVP